MRPRRIGWSLLALVALAATGVLTLGRRWWRTWGASRGEVTGPMPGDDLVPGATVEGTMAVTIGAPPERVWPWLVQMGEGRGGFYSYDWVDRLFGVLSHPSRWELLPEHGELDVDDLVPVARGPDFRVARVEEERALVLVPDGSEERMSWATSLSEPRSGHTRLVTRYRARTPSHLAALLVDPLFELAVCAMTRRWLLGVKARAERAEE